MSPCWQSRNVPFCRGLLESRVRLRVPVKLANEYPGLPAGRAESFPVSGELLPLRHFLMIAGMCPSTLVCSPCCR